MSFLWQALPLLNDDNEDNVVLLCRRRSPEFFGRLQRFGGIWQEVFGLLCLLLIAAPRGGSRCCCCSRSRGRRTLVPGPACRAGQSTQPAQVCVLRAKISFQNVCLSLMPDSWKSCCPSTQWIGAWISVLRADSANTQKQKCIGLLVMAAPRQSGLKP